MSVEIKISSCSSDEKSEEIKNPSIAMDNRVKKIYHFSASLKGESKGMKNFFRRLLNIIIFLTEKAYPEGKYQPECDSEIQFEIRFSGVITKGVIKEMQLREGQQVTVTARPKTRSGKDAAYDEGSVEWESSNPSVASVEENPDNELEATVKGLDGSANEAVVITCRLDGDPDEDEVRELIGSLDVVVTQGEAFAFELEAGAVTDSTGAEVPTEELPQAPVQPADGSTDTTSTDTTSTEAPVETTSESPAESPAPTDPFEAPTQEIPASSEPSTDLDNSPETESDNL
jgi:hypothetical protein